MTISKRAWESPFEFLPKHKKAPPGYSEILEEHEWAKNPVRKIPNAPPHVPVSFEEYYSLRVIGPLRDLFVFDGVNAYIPLLSKSGVTAAKAIRAIQAHIHKSIYNLENTKIPNISEDRRDDIYSLLRRLKKAEQISKILYDRLILISKSTTFQYDSQPAFSQSFMNISQAEAEQLTDFCKITGLPIFIKNNKEEEKINYYIPKTVTDEHGRQVKTPKYLDKMSKILAGKHAKFKHYSLIDSIIENLEKYRYIYVDLEKFKKLTSLVIKARERGVYLNFDVSLTNFENTVILDKSHIPALKKLDEELKEIGLSIPYFDFIKDRLSVQPENVKWELVVSAEPQDILTMSTNKGWSSCVEHGRENYQSLDSAVSNFDMVAYAIVPGKKDWQARVWLRYDGNRRWWPEPKVYKTGIIDNSSFLNAVEQYLKDKNILGESGVYDPNAFGWSDLLSQHIPEKRKKCEKVKLPIDTIEHLYDDNIPLGNVKLPATLKKGILAVPRARSGNIPKNIGIKITDMMPSHNIKYYVICFDVPEEYFNLGTQLFYKETSETIFYFKKEPVEFQKFKRSAIDVVSDILKDIGIKPFAVINNLDESYSVIAYIHLSDYKSHENILHSNDDFEVKSIEKKALCSVDGLFFRDWPEPNII